MSGTIKLQINTVKEVELLRKKVIAGNWKMNKTMQEARDFIKEVVGKIEASDQVEAVVCAPFPYLPALVEAVKGSPVKVGAQTMHYEESGAFTGEVSPNMLVDIGVSHVILGHSERREYFAETDETVNKKVHAALSQNLTPILCVGESLEQREAGETKSQVERQVKAALEGVSKADLSRVIIAYEPIWAIGTGKTASSEDANEVCAHVREVLASIYSQEVADQVVVQYGGSVSPDNVEELLATSDIDGALVGGASLEVDSFLQLVQAGAK